MILVVVGLPGSGKSTVAELLKEREFTVIEIGDIWRELLKKANIPRNDPRATREFTKTLREEQGKDIYAKYVVKKINKSMNKIVVMGVRSTYELNYLKKHLKGIVIIAIQSSFDTRYNRLATRGKPEDPKNLADFRWLNTREKRGFMSDKSEEKHGPVVIMSHANYTLKNTKTVDYLERQLDNVLKSIEK
ncbi:MAG: AAA family ATPase [Candidatus Micrarchaeaceae archaeon]|jgi:dephospho-CoA kinase